MVFMYCNGPHSCDAVSRILCWLAISLDDVVNSSQCGMQMELQVTSLLDLCQVLLYVLYWGRRTMLISWGFFIVCIYQKYN